MIYVYAPKSTDWTGNGQAVLDPTMCEINEQTGGQYELTMKHPLDHAGKWKYLINGAIIKAPVPVQNTPAITPSEVAYWRVKTTVTGWAKVYAKPLVYSYNTRPSASAWSPTTIYYKGNLVVSGVSNTIYEYVGPNGYYTEVPGTTAAWVEKGEYKPSGSNGYYSGGGEVGKMLAGSIFIKLANYDSEWMRIRMSDDTEGYINTSLCEYYGEMTELIPPRSIHEQCFRIYDVAIDSEAKEVNVSARHISYDIYNIIVGECNIKRMSPATAIAAMQAAMLIKDVRTIASNIEDYTVTSDWSWNNAAYALLDPEDGIVAKLNAKLVRDNNDFFILKNDAVNTNFRIEAGVNLVGVNWAVNTENVITRLVPKSLNANDTPLYLPEVYVDSDHIDDFPTIQMELLETDYKVGEQYTDEQGTTVTLTAEDCYRLMRRDCDRRYALDKVDKETFTMTVDFLNLGDTDEYSQYKALQSLSPYDVINIHDEQIGIDHQMQMVSYVWDALSERYTEATFEKFTPDEDGPLVTRPIRAMSSNSQDGCVVSHSNPSSTNGRLPYNAFDNNLNTASCNANYNFSMWIQMQMDVALKDIRMRVYSSTLSNFDAPREGKLLASNDGATWTQLATFKDWVKTSGGLLGEIKGNNTRAYQYVRLVVTRGSSVDRGDAFLCAIGNIVIEGRRVYTD